MKNKGKQRLPFCENIIYIECLECISDKFNYAQKISEHLYKPSSIIVRRLKILDNEGLVTSILIENKTTFPMQRKRLYALTKLGKNTMIAGVKIISLKKEIEKIRKQFALNVKEVVDVN